MHDLEQHEQDRTVYGYIYDSNGMHGEKIEFDGTPENLANFIMYNRNNAVVIADTMDQFVASSTQGGFFRLRGLSCLKRRNLREDTSTTIRGKTTN